MIAKMWAQQILNGGKTFKDVPRQLKDKVRNLLIESGNAELVME